MDSFYIRINIILNNVKMNFKNFFTADKILFFIQVFVLLTIIITSLINLTVLRSGSKTLWISLLSSSIGYLLPNPKFKCEKCVTIQTSNQ